MPARGEESLPTTCWLRFCQHSPACKWSSLLPEHTADPCSTCPQPEAQGLFLQSCPLASQRPDGPAVWVYSSLNTGFCICLSLNFMRYLSVHSSTLTRSHSIAALPSSPLTAPPKLLSSTDLLRDQQTCVLN